MLPSERATKIVKDRQQKYGHPADVHSIAASLWSTYLTAKTGSVVVVQAEDISMMMALLKIARETNRPLGDNPDDVCGYMNTYTMTLEKKGENSV